MRTTNGTAIQIDRVTRHYRMGETMVRAVEEPGVGWVAITTAGPELSSGKYPRTYLIRSANGMLTNLARSAKEPTVGRYLSRG